MGAVFFLRRPFFVIMPVSNCVGFVLGLPLLVESVKRVMPMECSDETYLYGVSCPQNGPGIREPCHSIFAERNEDSEISLSS